MYEQTWGRCWVTATVYDSGWLWRWHGPPTSLHPPVSSLSENRTLLTLGIVLSVSPLGLIKSGATYRHWSRLVSVLGSVLFSVESFFCLPCRFLVSKLILVLISVWTLGALGVFWQECFKIVCSKAWEKHSGSNIFHCRGNCVVKKWHRVVGLLIDGLETQRYNNKRHYKSGRCK